MFDRIGRGFALARCSWDVLWSNPKLLVFPFVSGLLFLVVLASFVIPTALLLDWTEIARQAKAGGKIRPPVWFYAAAFVFYFSSYFVTVFCNAALIGCAIKWFNNEKPTVADGFAVAFARLPQIAAWALVSASVGMLLKVVESLHEKLGEIIAGLLGTAWSVMTYFVVPVLVVEKVGPVDAVKKSVRVLTKTWGESLVGNMGIGFVMGLIALPLVVLLIVGVVLIAGKSVAAGAVLVGIAGVGLLVHAAVGPALHTILQAAVYQFAVTGRVPDDFDRDVLAEAFASKA